MTSQQATSSAAIARFVRNLRSGEKVFLDCGANDGCSTIKYLTSDPLSKVLSFEPNPILSSYHRFLPNTLVSCAVGTVSGRVEFIVDSVDSDGSTIILSKRADATGVVDNQNCPKIQVDCIDLVALIETIVELEVDVVLKLDIEGAEYELIEELIKSPAIQKISKFFCEFHWDRIGMPEDDHLSILNRLNHCLREPIQDWDAVDWMAVNLQGSDRENMLKKRRKALAKIYLKKFLSEIY